MFWKTAGGENFWDFATFKKFPPLFLHDLKQGGKFLKELYWCVSLHQRKAGNVDVILG